MFVYLLAGLTKNHASTTCSILYPFFLAFPPYFFILRMLRHLLFCPSSSPTLSLFLCNDFHIFKSLQLQFLASCVLSSNRCILVNFLSWIFRQYNLFFSPPRWIYEHMPMKTSPFSSWWLFQYLPIWFLISLRLILVCYFPVLLLFIFYYYVYFL